MNMLILIPILAFAVIFLHLFGLSTETGARGPWQKAFLLSAAIWAAAVTLISEGLSLIRAIDQFWLSVAWLLILTIVTWLGWRQGTLAASVRRLKDGHLDLNLAEWLLLGAMAVISLTLLVIGVVSPPNNVDSLLYHMSRVVHWAQDQSLRHYATLYNHQLLKPIWAETAILNLRVLWGNDRPASLIQWFSMVGCLIGASGIVALFGGNRRVQILAAALGISIPMGVLQATSTQNDYVTAFWVISLAYLVALSRKRQLTSLEVVGVALAFGLGLLTKLPFLVYAPPLMLWYFVPRLKPRNLGRLFGEGVVIGSIAVLLNAGFWTRNIITYGGPYGPNEDFLRRLRVFSHLDGMVGASSDSVPASGVSTAVGTDGGPADQARMASAEVAWGLTGISSPTVAPDHVALSLLVNPQAQIPDFALTLIRRMARMIALNLVTPSSVVNGVLDRGMMSLPATLDLGPDFQAVLDQLAWNHEDTAGAPIHVLLVPLALTSLVIFWRRNAVSGALQYAGVSLAAYALLALGGGSEIWGLRYQLPFFMLAAPIIAVGMGVPRWPRLQYGLAAVFVLLTLPWLLLNNTRPLIGLPPWPTRIGSIFTTPQDAILLAVDPTLRRTYVDGTNAVKASGCEDVGLRLDSSSLEYAFWWLLDAPQDGIHMETTYTYPYLERYIDPAFKPCAITCMTCGNRAQIHGVPLLMNSGRVSVFVGPDYVPEKGDGCRGAR
jgi:hypothetical protein